MADSSTGQKLLASEAGSECQQQLDGYCGVCGAKGIGREQCPDPNMPKPKAWRCSSCEVFNDGWKAFCHRCGVASDRDHHRALHRFYTRQGWCCLKESTENPEADPIRLSNLVIGFYFTMLLPVLVLLVMQLHWNFEMTLPWVFGLDALFVVIVLIFSLLVPIKLAPLLTSFPKLRAKDWLLILSAPLATISLANAQEIFLSPFGISTNTIMDLYGYTAKGFLLACLSVVVIPMVFEEIAFRGIILEMLKPLCGVWPAVIVSSFLFAIIHMNMIGLVFYLFPMALVAGRMTIKYRSLYPAMLVHGMHNAGIILQEWAGS